MGLSISSSTTTTHCPPVTAQYCPCGRVMSGNCPTSQCFPCSTTTTAKPCPPMTLQVCPCGRAWVGNCPGGCKPCPPATTTTTAASSAPALVANVYFKPTDPAHCQIDPSSGRMVIMYGTDVPLHQSFACHKLGQQACKCSRHPTHHASGCKEVYADGKTIHFGGDCKK